MDKQKEALDTYITIQQNKINELVQHIMMLESRIKILEKENENLKLENNINIQEIKSIKHARKTFSTVNSKNSRIKMTEEKEFSVLSQFKPKE